VKAQKAPKALPDQLSGSQLPTLRKEPAAPRVMPSRTDEDILPLAAPEPVRVVKASVEAPLSPLPEGEQLLAERRGESKQPVKAQKAPKALPDQLSGSQLPTLRQEPTAPREMPSRSFEPMLPLTPQEPVRVLKASRKDAAETPLSPLPEAEGLEQISRGESKQRESLATEKAPLALSDDYSGTKGTTIPEEPRPSHIDLSQVEERSEIPSLGLSPAEPLVTASQPRSSSPLEGQAKASKQIEVSRQPSDLTPTKQKVAPRLVKARRSSAQPARAEEKRTPSLPPLVPERPKLPPRQSNVRASLGTPVAKQVVARKEKRQASIKAVPHGKDAPVAKGQEQFSPEERGLSLPANEAEEQEVAVQAETITVNPEEIAVYRDDLQPEEHSEEVALPLTAHEADIEEQASQSQIVPPLIPLLNQGMSEPSVESEPRQSSVPPEEMESVAKVLLSPAGEVDVRSVKPVVHPLRTSPAPRLSIRRRAKGSPLKRVVVRGRSLSKESTDKPAPQEKSPTTHSAPTQQPPAHSVVPPEMAFLRRSQKMLQAQGWRFKEKPSMRVSDPSLVSRTVAQLTPQSSGGRKLDQKTRSTMEGALGRDFSDVRVHTVQLAPLNVQAASRGRDVYVEPGQESFETPQSMALLGHELTHVAHAGFAKSKNTIQRLTSSNEGVSILQQTRPPTGGDSSAFPGGSGDAFIGTSLPQDIASEEASAEQSEQKVMRYLQEPSTREAMPLINRRGTMGSSQPVMRMRGQEPDFTSGDSTGGTLAPLFDTSAQTNADVSGTVTQGSQLLQRMPLAGSETMIQRSESAPAQSEASDSSAQEKDDGKTSAQKLNQLARQIYPIIKRMLSVERERSFGR
jgi:hypothetical protein